MSTIDRIRDIAAPLLADRGLELYDVEQHGPVVRVTVDGPDGVGLDELSKLTRTLSLALDEQDPIPGRYTLEVSSPGLERPLRTASHFQRAIGDEVTVKTRVEVDGERRFRGTLTAADDEAIVLAGDGAERRLAYADIDKARTVFTWGPAPKPGKGTKNTKNTKNTKQKKTTTAKAASS